MPPEHPKIVHIFKSLYNIKPLIKICSNFDSNMGRQRAFEAQSTQDMQLGRSKRQVQLLFGLGEMLYVRIRKVAPRVVGLCLVCSSMVLASHMRSTVCYMIA